MILHSGGLDDCQGIANTLGATGAPKYHGLFLLTLKLAKLPLGNVVGIIYIRVVEKIQMSISVFSEALLQVKAIPVVWIGGMLAVFLVRKVEN